MLRFLPKGRPVSMPGSGVHLFPDLLGVSVIGEHQGASKYLLDSPNTSPRLENNTAWQEILPTSFRYRHLDWHRASRRCVAPNIPQNILWI